MRRDHTPRRLPKEILHPPPRGHFVNMVHLEDIVDAPLEEATPYLADLRINDESVTPKATEDLANISESATLPPAPEVEAGSPG